MINTIILDAIDNAANRHGVELALLIAVAHVETGGTFNPLAESPKGAKGLFQLMPATAEYYGVDPFEPAEAADAAAKFLKRQYGKFGNWNLALAAYNWGPANVADNPDRNAWPDETKAYVDKVNKLWKKKTSNYTQRGVHG